MITWDAILNNENKNLAINNILLKPGYKGPDGMEASGILKYLSVNEKTLETQLRENKYIPGYVESREIVNKKGKRRTIYSINSIDRFILKCISQCVQSEIEKNFSSNSFAYIEGTGTKDAVAKICEYVNDGYEYCLHLDIEKYFDNVNLEILEKQLVELGFEKSLLDTIGRFLRTSIKNGNSFSFNTKGLIQGSSLSPVLSNVYLTSFDQALESIKMKFVRFADDIKVFFKQEHEAKKALPYFKQFLEKNLNVKINNNKTYIQLASEDEFLGYVLVEKNGAYYGRLKDKTDKTIFSTWSKQAITTVDGHYQIVQGGVLTRKDFSILFENESVKREIPIKGIESLNVHSDITLTTEFLSFATKNSLPINFFDNYNKFIGRYTPISFEKASSCALKQMEIYLNKEKHLSFAKTIEIASIKSVINNIKYYNRRLVGKPFDNEIAKLEKQLDKLENCKKLEKVLLIEATSREIYYSCFNTILRDNPDFKYTKRTRMPPEDPINSLISYGNAIIYRRVADEIHKTSLDIRISFVHTANRRIENLNLDLAELFKPLIVDHVIFRLINRNMLDVHKHFEKHGDNGIWINNDGKRIINKEFSKRLYEKVPHIEPSITYEGLIRKEIIKLRTSIIDDTKYTPYYLK